MRIIIPDGYQDVVRKRRCDTELAGHEVVRYREPGVDLSAFASRLRDAEAIVPIRERA